MADQQNFFIKKLEDLGAALLIIVSEAIVAVAILLVGYAIAWVVKQLAPDHPIVVQAIQYITDGGAVAFLVIFVVKDMWEYIQKR